MSVNREKRETPILFCWHAAGAFMDALGNAQRPPLKAATVANLILAGASLVSLLVLMYFVYNYSWTGRRQFTDWSGIVLYYVGPAAAAVVLALALQLSTKRKIDLAILVCASLASIYGAETYLSLLSRPFNESRALWGDSFIKHRVEIEPLAKRLGVKVDFRSKVEILLELRKAGVEAVPSQGIALKNQDDGSTKSAIAIGGEEVLPLGGISNKTTVFCNEAGERTIYDSDERGFHNPRGLWGSKRVDIVALGDSFTEGGCVPSDKNFVALVRRHYPATLNLGLGGHGPLSMLGLLKETLIVIKPRTVLWFYVEENDAVDLLSEQKSALLLRYLESDFSQKLFLRQEAVDAALSDSAEKELAKKLSKAETFRTMLKDSHGKLVSIINVSTVRHRLGLVRGVENGGTTGSETTEKTMALFREIIRQAKDAVTRSDGQLYFVYLPALERYRRPPSVTEDRERVLLLVRSLDIPIIDVHPAFQSRQDPLALFPFGRFGHYNEDGHRIVAEQVLRSIAPKGS